MKTTKFEKKLNLNKATVTDLSDREMKVVEGGASFTGGCDTCCTCNTYCGTCSECTCGAPYC